MTVPDHIGRMMPVRNFFFENRRNSLVLIMANGPCSNLPTICHYLKMWASSDRMMTHPATFCVDYHLCCSQAQGLWPFLPLSRIYSEQ